MKPGDLQRNLARLSELARAAQARLVAVESEVAALGQELGEPQARPRVEADSSRSAAPGPDGTLGEVLFK